jgi:CheY-like chemotaxis protein
VEDGTSSTFESTDQQVESHSTPYRTILIVEDEVLVRLPMAEYLRDAGYRVIEASNAAEAVAIIGAGESLDAVFTDCNMPGRMNGIDLALWVRRSSPDIKVLMTSGASDLIHIADTAYGDIPLLHKPYALDFVCQKLADLIAAERS